MGILDKLFGRKKEDEESKRPVRRRAAPPATRVDTEALEAQAEAEAALPIEEMSAKELARKLGTHNEKLRRTIEKRLGELGDRTVMRSMINTYLMHGDEEAREALRGFGRSMSNALREFYQDMSNQGERRARILDLMALTGDDQMLPMVREATEHPEPLVRSRACAALTGLGDLHGVALLDHDLQTTDPEARRLALATLIELDLPQAIKCVEEHVERFVAESGAVSHNVAVSAPRLDDPQAQLIDFVLERVAGAEQELVVVIGSETIAWATSQRERFEEALPDVELHFGTRRMVPEEQIEQLRAARDAAAAGRRAAYVGLLPGPEDEPPLPHFLAREPGRQYGALVLDVDPHEYIAVQAWWRYLEDKSEVPAEMEVILGVSRPGVSAITDEEFALYKRLPSEEMRTRFVRALLARM